MRAHYLQHVHFEGLGSIASWLTESGYDISCSRLYKSESLPNLDQVDLLVIMGGPMSVNDEHEYPWLVAEKEYIRKAIQADKSVLGICLGAQLIASAMGAAVYQNNDKEIGWLNVEGVDSGDASTFGFPAIAEVFQWHGETFGLPHDARLLATSKVCKNQAFQLGSSVIGLQFHLETTPESARDIVTHCRDELVKAPYVHTEEEILAAGPDRYQAINQIMARLLKYLHRSRKG